MRMNERRVLQVVRNFSSLWITIDVKTSSQKLKNKMQVFPSILLILFVPNFLSNFSREDKVISEAAEYLNQWKLHSDIILINSSSSLSELLLSRSMSLTLVTTKTYPEFISKLNNTQESIYLFCSNGVDGIPNFVHLISNIPSKSFIHGFLFVVYTEKFEENNGREAILSQFKNISIKMLQNFHLNSDIYTVFRSNNGSWMLFEIYFLNSTKPVMNRIGLKDLGKKGSSRMNFQGITLRATAPEGNLTQGEIMWSTDDFGNLAFKGGFGTSILKSFQHSLNFRISAIPTNDWAKELPNGSWAGMANEVLQGRADIGIAKTSILPNRAKALDYLIPIHKLIVTAFFRQPPIGTVRNIFINPFEPSLWLAIICNWITILVVTVGLAYTKLKFHGQLDPKDTIVLEAPGVWAITAISQHGFYVTPKSDSMRIVFIAGILFGVLIFVGYAATLTSIFASKPIPIKNFEDLVRSGLKFMVDQASAGAKLVALRNPETQMTFTSSINLMLDKVGSGGNASLVSAAVGGGLVFDKEVAFLTFQDTFFTTVGNVYKKTDQYLCNTVSMFSVTNIPFRSGLFVAKNSPYKELFNNRVLCLYASGVMRRYVRNYEATYTPICNPELEKKETPQLGTNDVFFAYLLLIFGGVASGLILIVEILSRREIFRIKT